MRGLPRGGQTARSFRPRWRTLRHDRAWAGAWRSRLALAVLAIPALEVPGLGRPLVLVEVRLIGRHDRVPDDLVELGLFEADVIEEQLERRRFAAFEVLDQLLRPLLGDAAVAQVEGHHLAYPAVTP